MHWVIMNGKGEVLRRTLAGFRLTAWQQFGAFGERERRFYLRRGYHAVRVELKVLSEGAKETK